MTSEDQINLASSSNDGNRHSRIWKVTFTISIILLLIRVVLLATDIGSGSTSLTLFSLVVSLAVLAALFIVPLQMIRAFSVAQYNAVARANPGAIVIPASRAPFTRWALHFVGKHINLPTFQTWVITRGGMQVWHGGRHARLLANVPWSEIQYVSEDDNIRLGSGTKKSSAVVIERVNFAGSFSFFVRRPSRPMYPAATQDVQKAVAQIEPFILPRDN
jgi:hypothetical protein